MIVREQLGGINSILKPKSQEDVTNEIRRRLEGKPLDIIKETDKFTIYQVKRSDDIKEIVKGFGGRDEDVFYNFYLILDNSVTGFRQIIGVKVSPDGQMNSMDARGTRVEPEYLDKFA